MTLLGCGGPGRPVAGNLLREAHPLSVRGVANAERITDSVVPKEGDGWNTDLSAVLSRKAVLTYDLGQDREIRALHLVADNNDTFTLWISNDGKKFRRLWQAGPAPGPGMRARFTDGLQDRGRYLRLTAVGGDTSVSVGELMAFSAKPQPWPPRLDRRDGKKPDRPLQIFSALFGLALVLLIFGHHARPRVLRYSLWGLAGLASLAVAVVLANSWPASSDSISAMRLSLSAVALAGMARLSWSDARPRITTGILGLCGLLAVACFYNLGHPQFHNAAQKRGTYVHTFDMRVYFPVAKYFDELGFDGLYLASVAAYLEGRPSSKPRVERTRMRNLRDNQMVKVADVMDEVRAVKDRFSESRWRAFSTDMRFFWQTMGAGDYLGSLRDHGGNATPAWLAIAHLMFASVTASEGILLAAGLIDPLLLGLFFVAVWRSFGPLSAGLCMIVFGCSDFPMLGSNWAGSTLRLDWMVCLGLAACALKRGHHLLGGALLGLGAMLRAFPVLAFIFMAVPALWWLLDIRRQGNPPSKQVLIETLRPLLRAVAGGLAVVVLLFGLSSALFVDGSWTRWLDKISLHSEKPNVNHVGLRTVLSHNSDLTARKLFMADHPEPWTRWQHTQRETRAQRKPLFVVCLLLFSLLSLLACRGRTLQQAALTGLILIPIFFYPANYYLHCVFLLPLLADERREPARFRWVSACLLLLCAGQYFTLGRYWTDVRFYYQSLMLLAAYAAILTPQALSALRTKGPHQSQS